MVLEGTTLPMLLAALRDSALSPDDRMASSLQLGSGLALALDVEQRARAEAQLPSHDMLRPEEYVVGLDGVVRCCCPFMVRSER